MADVKWIKITTNIFEDEKIEYIQELQDGSFMILNWIKLITLAGKCNAKGCIYLTESKPYPRELLAKKFKTELAILELSLSTFEELGMIEIDEEGYIYLSNWEKHQNIEGLERIREQNRLRKQKQRAREKLQKSDEIDSFLEPSHDGHATDIEEDIDKELEVDKDIYKSIIEYLNEKTNKCYSYSTKSTINCIKARLKEGYTIEDFKNVIDIKTNTWLYDIKMSKFLRPTTLFGDKFESYLNEVPKAFTESNDYGW